MLCQCGSHYIGQTKEWRERLYRHQSNPQSQSCNLSYHLLDCEYNPSLLTY